ncbi:sigma-54 interaction domain-containing protein [Tepidibacter mesophilus]|uniref:sigma-54 interaction domain-containing protein n=1 Tax=Tepidibacter mesophilus TaxID=655607 RepID=UPI000C07204C|nr:sigma 54-interacting transcriptional regulator [Tepidibacter mesophilus]
MKNIGIITDTNSQLADFLKENLNMVFKDYVNINNYYLNELKKGEYINDDIVLVMLDEKAIKIKQYMKNIENVVVINRTISEKVIYKLFKIPANIDVLVINDINQTTLETISMLYKIGVNHLNLIPYENDKEYSNIKVAITPGEKRKVPQHINKIIDLGHRLIDVSTFIEIMNKLGIEDKKVGKKLIKYTESIVSLDNGIKDKYKELFSKSEELDNIINFSNDGIVVIDKSNKISVFNEAAKKIFDINYDVIGMNIGDVFDESMKKKIDSGEFSNKLIEFNDKHLNVSKYYMKYFEEKVWVYFNIQEITYIKKLEQNLSKQLKQKGQIARYRFQDIKTNSNIMKNCVNLSKKLAKSDLTILITGESGTGKELLAQSIHNESDRKNQPFIAINCAAVPENLLESELFGYEKGAFTGALKEGKKGLFEQAHNGTIFLDEIGDMPTSLQTKLLRVLQERQVMRIGSENLVNIDIRVISATNKNLIEEIKRNNFREDLYYRLNVLPIEIPPIRHRKDDIIPLIYFYMNKKLELEDSVKDILSNYRWPGNIREIKNVASYISIMSEEIVNETNLPLYILKSYQNVDEEINIIQSDVDLYKVLKILKAIKEHNNLNKTSGRSNLYKYMKLQGFNINESEIRKILVKLNGLNIISSHVGRVGSKITYKGNQVINRLENRF